MADPKTCSECDAPLTAETTTHYKSLSVCDLCEWKIRDDLAWLTGTGRFAQ